MASAVVLRAMGPAVLVAVLAVSSPAVLAQSKDAEPATREANAAVLNGLPFSDRQDFEDARRGFLAALPDGPIAGPGATPIWDMKRYGFLDRDEAPTTVNPSLWRQAQLNAIHGLFKVGERVYQIRGLDIANMTIIEGEEGIIVLDTLLTAEAARAALDLYYGQRPRKPVTAVIYSHSHADHFGGVKGVVSEADVKAGRVKIYAPDGFMEHAVAENVIAGNAMSRRAQYMYGPLLPSGEKGQVDTGLGKNLSRGTLTLLGPTDLIRTNETRTIDGVEIRDGNAWSHYIGEALQLFGQRTDVLIAQHHWPTFGSDKIVAYLKKQRDLYKFINDQSLRLLNQGLTPAEIAETLRLPATLANEWALRGYYGTLRHNARAVYQKYLGWYDSNPANLDPLPPAAAARKAVEYMGGAQAVIARAREDFRRGEYRWVASVMKEVVFADPGNREARELAADALEQLGYQAEAGTWRNEYLVGALELRSGPPKLRAPSTLTADTLAALSLDNFFDLLGVRLNGPRAEGKIMRINWDFTDVGEKYALNLENSALTYTHGLAEDAQASLALRRATLDSIMLKQTTFAEAATSGQIAVAGDPAKLVELLGLFDDFDPMFEIVAPKQ